MIPPAAPDIRLFLLGIIAAAVVLVIYDILRTTRRQP